MPLTNEDAAYLAEKLSKKVMGSKTLAPDVKGTGFIPAQIPLPDVSQVNFDHLERTARKAEPLSIVWHTNTEVAHYPTLLRPFAALLGKVFLFLGQVITKPQQRFNTAVMENLNALREGLSPLQASINSVSTRFDSFNALLALYEKRQTLLGKHIEYLELLLDRVPVLERNLNESISGLDASLRDLTNAITSVESHSLERYNAALAQTSRIESSLNAAIGERLTQTAALSQRIHDIEQHGDILQGRLASMLDGVLEQERRLAVLIEEAKRRMPDKLQPDDLKKLAGLEETAHDSFYLDFENQFRGSREEISVRLSEYVPDVKSVASKDFPIVDLGCGRGEWLTILREQGIPASGIDSNSSMISACKAAGLDVREGDAIAALRDLPDGSVGVVTGFHIVEHLPFEVMLKLFDETRRVLRKGGIAIFETPNPENVIVGSNSFYLDPTHRHPLPPAFLKFVAEQRGFANVELRFLHPVDTSQLLSENTPTSNRV